MSLLFDVAVDYESVFVVGGVAAIVVVLVVYGEVVGDVRIVVDVSGVAVFV